MTLLGLAAALFASPLRATAERTSIADFRTFPQGVWFDLEVGWDAPPLRGRVTSPYLNTAFEQVEFFLQDDSGGLRIRGAEYGYFFSSIPGAPALIPGIEVEVGYFVRLVEENGELIAELDDPEWSLRVTDANPAPPVPLAISAADLLGGGFDGWLVQLNDVQSTGSFSWPLHQNDQSATVADTTGTVRLFIDKDTSLPGQSPPQPGINYDVTGIVVTGSDATPGLRMLMPRKIDDFDVAGMENLPPTIQAPETAVGAPGMPLTFVVVGNDLNPQDELSFSVDDAPDGASFSPVDPRRHQFSWTPSAEQTGEWTVTFEVSDGEFSATARTLLIVRPLSGGPDHPWINEFHYDNIGIDVDEGIELAGRAGIDLAPYRLYTYRTGAPGAPGVLYGDPIQFEGVIPDETGTGYGAVWFGVEVNRFQNAGDENVAFGAGFALVHADPVEGDRILQFISYEGSFTAIEGPAAGLVAVDVGVAQGSSTPIGHSLTLFGNGSAIDAHYEQFAWMGPAPATPGRINNGQTFGGVGGRASVDLGPPVAAPALPSPMEPFEVQVSFSRTWSANLLSATLWYSTDDWATTNSVPLSLPADQLTGTGTTLEPLPGLPLGGAVAFYAEVAFAGNQAESPAVSETTTLTIRQRIAFQGFELSAGDTWSYDAHPQAGSIVRVSAPTAEGDGALRIGGQSAHQPPAFVAFDNQFIAGYSDVRLSIAYAGRDVDTDDELLLSLSYDGGTTWNPPIVLASGFSNWSFGFGEVHPGTQRPFTAGANPYEVSLPAGVEQVAVRVTHQGNPTANNTRDFYYIDSVALTASGGSLNPLPPAFEPTDPVWQAEANRVNTFTVAAYDPNGGPVTLTLAGGLPAGAGFSTQHSGNRTVGTLAYEPAEADIGSSFVLTFAATDSVGQTLMQQPVAVIEPFRGLLWDFDDGTAQGWTQHRYGHSVIPLWDWDVYPDAFGLSLSQGPGSGEGYSPHYAGINGYSLTNPQPVDAWWRSPVIEVAHLDSPTLTFATWYRHAGPDLELYGTFDVHKGIEEANWIPVPFDVPTAQQTWRRAEVSLHDWSANPFRLAFRYQADGTAGGSKAWAVDTIRIDEPPPPPIPGRILISEYGEGSGHNKYIELFNASTTESVDLGDYELRSEINGVGGYTGSLPLSGLLPPGATFVVAHSDADDALRSQASLLSRAQPIQFNGNDAVGLFFLGALEDAVGPLGDASYWGRDLRLIRRPEIGAPRPVYDPSEWIVGPMDDWSDIGRHTFGEPLDMPQGLEAAPIGTIGFTLAWQAVDGATQYRLQVARNAGFTDLVDGHDGLITTVPTVAVGGLAPDTPYWARVTALEGLRESPVSAALEVRTRAALPMLTEYGAGAANNNMYLELYNPHAFPISLQGIAIRKRTSTLTGFDAPLNLAGTLAPGATQVVVHAAAEQALRDLADLVSDADALAFNGRHAVALFRGESLIDVIGWPSVAWGVDKTFVRRTDITSPNPVYTPEEWIELAADDWTDVGWFGEPSNPTEPILQPRIVALDPRADGVGVVFSVSPERQAGVVYRLQRRRSTPSAGWDELPAEPVPETPSRARLADPAPSASGGLYRVRAFRP